MKVRVKNKKVLSIWCLILVFMILNLTFAISKRSNAFKVSNSQIALAANKNGSISKVENDYFTKYILDCASSKEEIKWEQSKDYIEIYLDKKDIVNLNIKGVKGKNRDIFYTNSKDKLAIKIKRNFSENNFVYIDSSDNKKVVALIAKKENPFKNTVVLDAGHGGIDKGANYGEIYEKDITLKIANYTAEQLMFNGFKVIKTREEDKLLDLKEVGNIANNSSADIFVSIHINDNKSSTYKGVSTYYYDPNGYQKEERIKFAKIMQKELVREDDWEDRDIFRQDLAVLRYSKIPCVLLECGFLSNAEDREKLTKDEVLKNFAVNITNGISNYLSAE